MPRLTIIIPHRLSDERLEATLVSVLENRPEESEVIVVHDGTYSDSYNISDEAVLIQGEPGASTTQLLNTATRHANAQVVSVVLDGVTVLPGWADGINLAFEDPAVACLAVNSDSVEDRRAGITPVTRASAKSAISSRLDASLGSAQYAGPSLACGFYRRSALQELGGWNERLSVAAADVELAWLMQSVGVVCESASGLQFSADENIKSPSIKTVRQLAELCVAYGVTGSGYAAALTGWFAAATSGQLKSASAWSGGMLGGAYTRGIIARLNLAQKAMQELASEPAIVPFSDSSSDQQFRRAA